MSGPVDVLAVMDEAYDQLSDTHAAPLLEARAAVAELIEAVDGAVAFGASHTAWRELRAALVRVGAK